MQRIHQCGAEPALEPARAMPGVDRSRRLAWGSLLALLLLWCVPLSGAAAPRTVVVSVEPLAMVLRPLYGERAMVVALLAPNQSPHHPMLSPRQMLTLRQADLLVWLGADAEPAMAALVAKRRGASVALLDLPGITRGRGHQDHHDHADGDADQAGHAHHTQDPGLDPHLWLDPDNMAALARALDEREGDALAAGQPAAFLDALARAERLVRAELAPVRQVPWLTYHQPWAYFQHHFGLHDAVIVSEQLGAGPSSRHFVALAEATRRQGVTCALVEPEAQVDLLRRLCPACRLQPLDPLGRDHAGATYDVWLVQVAQAFRECLAGGQ